jgi:hypothetical protein
VTPLHEGPKERLWRKLRDDWFRDEPGMRHPGEDIEFCDLPPDDVERLWQLLRSRADPIDPTAEAWDEDAERPVNLVEALAAGAVAFSARCRADIIGLSGISSSGVKLPVLGISLWESGVSLYWWVGDEDLGWRADTAAALAELIGELRELVPHATVQVEGGAEADEFWLAIDEYLAER